MTDLISPPSARRFAALLERDYCVWMPSPSLALLSALVTGRGRPKRLLVQENAPAFIAKIGLVTGAAPVIVEPNTIDRILDEYLRDDGMSPDLVWGIATHREGKLAPTDWLARCAAFGVPTIELCLGSLRALEKWGPSPATFTIVDLDAEAAFAGAHVAALLTGDSTRAARVQKLCLPSPGSQDYVFDAGPRGLAYDEPALASLVDRAASQSDEEPLQSSTRASGVQWTGPLQSALDEQRSLAEEWQRRFQAAESEGSSRAQRDSALLLEAEKTLVEKQRTIDQWEARFREAESEAERDAATLTTVRADLGTKKAELESALASMRAENESLVQKLRRAERERDLAVADAGRRDESERVMRSELRKRTEEFETEAAAFGQTRAELLKQKTEAEQALVSIRSEKLELSRKLGDLDAELSEALAEAARQAAEQRTALDAQNERTARLEKELAAAAAREAAFGREREGAKATLSGRIAELKAEKEALLQRVSAVESERDRAGAESGRREEERRAEIAEHKSRAERLETEAAAKNRVSAEAAQRTAQLKSRVQVLEAETATLRQTAAEAAQRTAELEKAIATKAAQEAASIREREAAKAEAFSRIVALEASRDLATTEAVRNEEAKRLEIAEYTSRLERLETEAAALRGAAAEADHRATQQSAALDEASQRAAQLERAIATLTAREAGHMREREAARVRERDAASADVSGQIAALHAEKQALEERLSVAETDRDRHAAEASRRAERIEAEATAFKGREARLTEEGERTRSALFEKIRRLEAGADAAQKALAELLGEKSLVERLLAQGRAEAQIMSERLAEAERLHSNDLANATKDHGAERASLIERITRLEAAAAAEAAQRETAGGLAAEVERVNASLGAEAEEANRKLAEAALREEALRAELMQQRELVLKLRNETAASAQRSREQAETWEAARVDLVARIARLEAAGAIADKARDELLNRKKDSDRALAEAGADRAALLKKLAIAERERDEAQARADLPPKSPDRAAPVASAGERNTGGLSALVNLWNTALTRRPAPRLEAPGSPQEPEVEAVPQAGIKGERNTGGLNALVSLWNTAKTLRPMKRKPAEAGAGVGEKPAPPIFGIEEIPNDEAPLRTPVAAPPAETSGKPDRISPAAPARPTPSRRPPPPPKPVPPAVPDGTEELGGWLRNLGSRLRPKK